MYWPRLSVFLTFLQINYFHDFLLAFPGKEEIENKKGSTIKRKNLLFMEQILSRVDPTENECKYENGKSCLP